MANKDNDFSGNENLKSLLNVVINKMDSYEHKIDSIETKVSELSIIKHQIDSFKRQVDEILLDLKSLRSSYEGLKNTEYRVEDLIKWKNLVEQTLTISDLALLKTKSFNQELIITQLTERLLTVKEEIKKETMSRSLLVGGGAGSAIVALVQAISYLLKSGSGQ